MFVVRKHFEYDRENNSSTEAVFTEYAHALRYAIGRIIDQKIDNDCVYLHSATLAAKLNLSDLSADITEEESDEVMNCLKSISSLTELNEIFDDAMHCQHDGSALEKFYIDELLVDNECE